MKLPQSETLLNSVGIESKLIDCLRLYFLTGHVLFYKRVNTNKTHILLYEFFQVLME